MFIRNQMPVNISKKEVTVDLVVIVVNSGDTGSDDRYPSYVFTLFRLRS